MILHTPNSKPGRMATVLETTILLYSQILWVKNLGIGNVCNCSTKFTAFTKKTWMTDGQDLLKYFFIHMSSTWDNIIQRLD